MEQQFYKNVFQALKSLRDLKVISEEEKSYLKEMILNDHYKLNCDSNVQDITMSILYRVRSLRKRNSKKLSSNELLSIIDEETDEEISI